MFGEKTNDKLVTSIVSVLGVGIIFTITTSYQLKNDVKVLKENFNKASTSFHHSLDSSNEKINILVAYIQENSPKKLRV